MTGEGWLLSFVVNAASDGFDRHRSLIATTPTGRYARITGYSATIDSGPPATDRMGKAIAGHCQGDGLAQIVR
jgi:hypothetical protein